MPSRRITKIVKNGAREAVKVSTESSFEGNDGDTSAGKNTDGAKLGSDFFAFMKTVNIPKDFMKDRPMNSISKDRKPLFREED